MGYLKPAGPKNSKKIMTEFWPGVDGNIMNFAYSTQLKKETFTEAVRTLNQANAAYTFCSSGYYDSENPLSSGSFANGLQRLKTMQKEAFDAEMKYINTFKPLLGENYSTNDWSGIVRIINTILGKESIYDDSLRTLYNLASSNDNLDKKQYSDIIAKNGFSTINKNVKKVLVNNKLNTTEDQIKEAILDSLIEIYENANGQDLSMGDYGEIITALKNIKSLQAFSNCQLLNDIYSQCEKKINSYQKEGNYRKTLEVQGKSKTAHGNLKEAVDTGIANIVSSEFSQLKGFNNKTMQCQFHWTGGATFNQPKADIIGIYDSTYTADFKQDYLNSRKKTNNVRDGTVLQNIKTIQDLLNKIKNSDQQIVFISNKNYKISTIESGGISAVNNKFTLNNMGAVLSYAQVDRIDELIFTIMNIGGDTIGDLDDLEDIELYLATEIGRFMFDDINISGNVADSLGQTGVNRVHIFEINGIYLPFSFYLSGLIQSFETLDRDIIKDMAKIKISPAKDKLSIPSGTSFSNWMDYANQRKNNTTISVHFMRNFTDFMMNYIHL